MDQHRAPIPRPVRSSRSLDRGDQHVGRALPVGMSQDLDVVRERPVHCPEHLFHGRCRVTRIARSVFADRVVVRPVTEGGEALR